MTVYFKTEINCESELSQEMSTLSRKHKAKKKNPKCLCFVVTDNIKKIPLHHLTSDTYMIHTNKTKIRLLL